jgi:hypothetical protein
VRLQANENLTDVDILTDTVHGYIGHSLYHRVALESTLDPGMLTTWQDLCDHGD